MDQLDKEIEECFKYVENLGTSDEAVKLFIKYNILEHAIKKNESTKYDDKLKFITIQSDIMYKLYNIMKGKEQ